MIALRQQTIRAAGYGRVWIEEFGIWANSELAKLDHMALQEALSASMDEALLNPDLRHLFRQAGPPPAENS